MLFDKGPANHLTLLGEEAMPTVSAPGKRSLFFTYRKNEESWRLTEKVAAVLEGNFVGDSGSVYTFSTASVPNGTPFHPPLDVVFSTLPDPLAAFAFVQVKDFTKDKVNREFIDAVIGQRVQTGLETCCVVSTTGFTAPALELARVQDVRLRVLTPGATWPYPGYLPSSLGVHLVPSLHLQEAVLLVSDPPRTGKVAVIDDNLLRPVLEIDGVRSSVGSSFRRLLASPEHRGMIESLLETNPRARVINVGQEFTRSKVVAYTLDGTYAVGGIAYHAAIFRPDSPESPVSRRYLYHDPLTETDLAWCAMADFTLSGLHEYGLDEGLHHYCLWRFLNGESDSVGGAIFPG